MSSRVAPTLIAAVLAGSLAAVARPAVARATLPAGNPEFLVQTDACEDTLDRSNELTLSGFAVTSTDAGGGLSDVEVDATISNSDVGDFARAAAIPRFGGSGLDVEADPPVVPMGFDDIAPNGTAPISTPMTLRLPTDQVDDLEAALDAGDVRFVVHARERLHLQPNTYIVAWTDHEDALAADTGTPIWTSASDEPFGIGELPEGNRVFVIVDEYDPENIVEDLWYVEYLGAEYNELQGYWDVDFGEFDVENEDIDDVVLSGSFCGSGALDDPADGQPVRFNAFDLGPVSVSGQVAGQLLGVSSSLSVREGEGRWDFEIGVDASFTAQLSAEVTEELDESLDLIDLCFTVAAIPVGVTSIPVALHVTHTLGASGSASAGMVVGFQKRFDGGYRLGFDTRHTAGEEFYSEAFWEPTPVEFTPPRLTEDTGLDIRATAGLELGIYLGYSCPVPLISAGAHAEAEIFGELSVDPEADPWWSLSHGASIDAGLDLDLLGFQLLGLEAPIVDFPGTETREGAQPGGGGGAGVAGVGDLTSGVEDRWAVAIDDLGASFDIGESDVLELSDGSIVVGGNRLVARFAPDGQLEWARALKAGTNYAVESLFVVDDSTVGVGVSNGGNNAILGFVDPTTGDAIAATDYDARPVGGSSKCALDDAITFEEGGERGYLLVGRVNRSTGAPQYDICAIRLDASGAVVWSRLYGDDTNQTAHAVARTPDGGFAVVGSSGTGFPGDDDDLFRHNALVMRLDGDGDVVWSNAFPTTDYRADDLYDVVVDEDGRWFFTGEAQPAIGDGALVVGTVTPDGVAGDLRIFFQDEAWEIGDGAFESYVDTQGGETVYDRGMGIALAPGGIVVAGRTSIPSGVSPPSATWALKLGEDLGVEWFQTWDGEESDVIHAIAPSTDGFLASGKTDSTMHLGTGSGGHGLLLVKLPFEGAIDPLPGTEMTDRYVASKDHGFPTSPPALYEPNPLPAGTYLPLPMSPTDGDPVTASPISGFVQTTAASVCVQLLTEPGNPSVTDGCAEDDDGDAILADDDLCDEVYDPDQTDTDGDLVGDACDDDDDGDALLDGVDGCPLEAEDADGYHDADGCPEAGSYVDPCSAIPTIEGTGAGETLNGTAEDDVIFGYGGADAIFGNGGSDLVCAGAGSDTVTTTGPGRDGIRGMGGADEILGSGGPDVVHGDSGDDVIRGGNGADLIWGNLDDDTLYGQKANDVIRGGPGTDTCSGGPGIDQIFSCP